MFAINSKDEPLFSPDWESRLALVNVVQTRFIGSGDREFFKKLIDNKEFIVLDGVVRSLSQGFQTQKLPIKE